MCKTGGHLFDRPFLNRKPGIGKFEFYNINKIRSAAGEKRRNEDWDERCNTFTGIIWIS